MSDAPGFIHLRCHSAYSLLEGMLRVKDLAKLTGEHAMPAAALTDRNNLFGALEFSETLAEAGVQPILGLTLSVRLPQTDPLASAKAKRGAPEDDPCVALLAQNEAGYQRLMALASAAFLDIQGADAPHVPWDRLVSDTEGLLCLTGGPEGPANRLAATGKGEEAGRMIADLASAFPDRLYVEFQRHGLPQEAAAEEALLQAAYAQGVPIVATNQPYFAKPEDYAAHEALLCIADATFLSVDERRRATPRHHFASPAEMAERFADLPEAVSTTLDVARRCAVRPLPRKPILPAFTTEAGRDEAAEFAAQAREGLEERLSANPLSAAREEYDKRLEHEIDVIVSMGFPGYFLIVADFIKWSKAQGIPVGPGRGSGAGSLVAWALTITDLDPLRFNLVFERFLNPERVSMPDFDIDFCQERREEVIDYVAQKYGRDRTAQIITFGTLQARAVVRDVGRVMQLPFGMVDRLAKLIPNNPANPTTLAEALDTVPELQAERDREPDVANLIDTALALEGLYRNASTHAAGVVIGDRPLPELVPLYRDPRALLPATQFNMKWVEIAGLVKFDFLGLKTLTVLTRAQEYLATRGVELDVNQLDLEDEPTFEMMRRGDTVGVFQFESGGMRDLMRKAKPSNIEDLIALVALFRPGPMENIPKYLGCKHGTEERATLHPIIDDVTADTYSVIIYQEQVMQIAQRLAGYSLGEADLLRRAMGKKKPEEMEKQRVRFLQGAKDNDVDEHRADMIFETLARFAGYGFNKAHSAAYAYVAYQTAYLKAHYPVEFIAASMSLDADKSDKLAHFAGEARRMGVQILAPDVNGSEADFTVEERPEPPEDGLRHAVRFGLGAVRNLGMEAMKALVAAREEGGPFVDLWDVAKRVDPQHLNKRAWETLAAAGAFDGLGVHRAAASGRADAYLRAAAAAAREKASDQVSLFGDAPGEAPAPRVEADAAPWSPAEQLEKERDAVGFYVSGHPLEDARPAMIRAGVRPLVDALAVKEDGRCKVAGVVRARQERVSAKSNGRFAFVTLSDPSGEAEVFVTPETLAVSRKDLEVGAQVVCALRLTHRDGETRAFVDGVEPLAAALAGAYPGLLIDAQSDALDAVIAILRGLDADARGPVALRVPLTTGHRGVVALPGAWPVDADARARLKACSGVEQVIDHDPPMALRPAVAAE